jgi:hypothetical protein
VAATCCGDRRDEAGSPGADDEHPGQRRLV